MDQKKLEELLADYRNFLKDQIQKEEVDWKDARLDVRYCERAKNKIEAYRLAEEKLRELFPEIDLYGSLEKVKY